MNESAIKDLHYEWYLKILSKLHVLLGECNMKEFLNITDCVNPWQTNCDQEIIMSCCDIIKFNRP